MEGNFRRGWRR